MEHLGLSSSNQGFDIEVPYICKERYDRGPFLSYPARQGWKREELFCRRAWDSSFQCDDPYCAIHKCDCTRAHSVPDNTAFLQNWLFFGLLNEVFGRVDFVTERNGSQFISTATLVNKARMWLHFCDAWSENERIEKSLELEDVVQEAYDMFLFVCARGTVDPVILVSIGLVGEFVVSRLQKLIPLSMKDYTEWRGPGSLEQEIHTNYLMERMLDLGWCPSDILKLQLFDVSGLCLAMEIGTKRSSFDHSNCTETHCVQLQDYNEAEYVTAHVEADCSCEFIASRVEDLVAALDDDRIPLINVDRFQVETAHRYVAISHVWSDGLGNPRGNALPLCQLRRLNKWVKDLDATDDPWLTRSFWMDTLNCPVRPLRARKKAIRLMGKTYHDAAKVLMLDSSLTSLDHKKMPNREIAMRIYLSTWGRRLWTFQEGVLAKSLYIQFADGALDFDAFRSQLRWAFANDPEPGEPWSMLLHGDQIRGHTLSNRGATDGYRMLVAHANSLHGRSVSKPADEPICLATLLGIETREILDAQNADRMKTFWRVLNLYNRSLIWWKGPCLDSKGFRWAPSSLLNPRFQFPEPDDGDNAIATRTEDGLLVRYPGILLEKATSWLGPGVWLRNPQTGTFPFYVMTGFDNEFPREYVSLALIIKTPVNMGDTILDPLEIILVAISDTRYGIHYATILGSGLLSSGDGPGSTHIDEGMTAHAQKDLDDLKRQITMESILLLRDEFETLRSQGHSEPTNEHFGEVLKSKLRVSRFCSRSEGYQLGFDMTLQPSDQEWCLERDPNWQHPHDIQT